MLQFIPFDLSAKTSSGNLALDGSVPVPGAAADFLLALDDLVRGDTLPGDVSPLQVVSQDGSGKAPSSDVELPHCTGVTPMGELAEANWPNVDSLLSAPLQPPQSHFPVGPRPTVPAPDSRDEATDSGYPALPMLPGLVPSLLPATILHLPNSVPPVLSKDGTRPAQTLSNDCGSTFPDPIAAQEVPVQEAPNGLFEGFRAPLGSHAQLTDLAPILASMGMASLRDTQDLPPQDGQGLASTFPREAGAKGRAAQDDSHPAVTPSKPGRALAPRRDTDPKFAAETLAGPSGLRSDKAGTQEAVPDHGPGREAAAGIQPMEAAPPPSNRPGSNDAPAWAKRAAPNLQRAAAPQDLTVRTFPDAAMLEKRGVTLARPEDRPLPEQAQFRIIQTGATSPAVRPAVEERNQRAITSLWSAQDLPGAADASSVPGPQVFGAKAPQRDGVSQGHGSANSEDLPGLTGPAIDPRGAEAARSESGLSARRTDKSVQSVALPQTQASETVTTEGASRASGHRLPPDRPTVPSGVRFGAEPIGDTGEPVPGGAVLDSRKLLPAIGQDRADIPTGMPVHATNFLGEVSRPLPFANTSHALWHAAEDVGQPGQGPEPKAKNHVTATGTYEPRPNRPPRIATASDRIAVPAGPSVSAIKLPSGLETPAALDIAQEITPGLHRPPQALPPPALPLGFVVTGPGMAPKPSDKAVRIDAVHEIARDEMTVPPATGQLGDRIFQHSSMTPPRKPRDGKDHGPEVGPLPGPHGGEAASVISRFEQPMSPPRALGVTHAAPDAAAVAPLAALPPARSQSGPAAGVLPPHVAGDLLRGLKRSEVEDRVELILDPAELGRVRFEMTQGSDRLQVTINVERPETLELLRRHVEILRTELREAGFTGADLNFNQWGGGRQETPTPPVSIPEIDQPALPFVGIPVLVQSATRSAGNAGGLDLRL